MKVVILHSNEVTATVFAHLIGQEIEVMTEEDMGTWAGENEDRNGLLACVDWDTYSYVMPISDSGCYSFKKEWVQPVASTIKLWVRVGMEIEVDPSKIHDRNHIIDAIRNGEINGESYAPADGCNDHLNALLDDGIDEICWGFDPVKLGFPVYMVEDAKAVVRLSDKADAFEDEDDGDNQLDMLKLGMSTAYTLALNVLEHAGVKTKLDEVCDA